MKKGLLLILGTLLFCLGAIAQPPNTSKIGSPKTYNKAMGVSGADTALAISATFTDTAAANRGFLKTMEGAIIRINGDLWVRNTGATAWIKQSGSGGGGNTPSLQQVTNVDSVTNRQIVVGGLVLNNVQEYPNNAAAIADGKPNGYVYSMPYNNGNYGLAIVRSAAVITIGLQNENGTFLLNENGQILKAE